MRFLFLVLFAYHAFARHSPRNGTDVRFLGATLTILPEGLAYVTPEVRAALNGDASHAEAPEEWKREFGTEYQPQACVTCSLISGTMRFLASGTVYAAGSSHPTRLGAMNWGSGVVTSCRCLAGCRTSFGSSARGLGGSFLCEHGPGCDQCECFDGNSPLPVDAPDCTGCGAGEPQFVEKC
jgi:hypothetical protein